MEAFGGHVPQAASLVGASHGDDLLIPVRQAAQPPQQTTVHYAQGWLHRRHNGV
jgi:hypothetical protein